MKCHLPASFVLSFDGPLNLMGESGNLQGFSSFRTDPEQPFQWNASMRVGLSGALEAAIMPLILTFAHSQSF